MFDTIDDKDVEIGFNPVAKGTREDLAEHSPLHTENYAGFKEDFLKWLLRTGKSPGKGTGYAQQTVRQTHYRIEHVFRWKWEEDGEVTTDFTPEERSTSHLSSLTLLWEISMMRARRIYQKRFLKEPLSHGRVHGTGFERAGECRRCRVSVG